MATGSGWSLVYTLNNRGDSTEPCGWPFRWFRHLLCLPFSSTLNRRFDSIVLINFVSGTSSVSITSLTRSRRWLMVSQAAVRSMNAAPVIWPSSKPSAMCWVMFSTCEQHDFPGLKSACCGIMLDLALKASEDHPLEKLVQRAEESDRPVALWAFWIFSWLQQ